MKMYKPKRLHPLAAALNILKWLKDLIIPLLLLVLFGRDGDAGDVVSLIISGAAILAVGVSGVLSWLRYTYFVTNGELRIEYGVFVRKKRYIPIERIQSLDFSESLLHRLFRVVKVNVETAGSSEIGQAEAVLAAVKKEEALEMEAVLRRARKPDSTGKTGDVPEKHEEIIYQISSEELLLLASTSGGIGVVLSAVAAFFSQFDDLIPYEKVFKEFETFISHGILFVSMAVFAGFVIAYAVSVIYIMMKYADFTLKKVNEDLIVTRGLLEKRQITVPLKRIQGVHICENLLRQPFHFATVFIVSAGGSFDKDSTSKVMVLPIIRKDQIKERLEKILPGYDFSLSFHPAPKRAFRRYLFRGAFFCIIPVTACLFFLKKWGLFSLLLFPLAAAISFLKYKDAGWALQGDGLSLRYREIIRHTVFMKKGKIQTLEIKENYFQKRKKLATVSALIKSGIASSGGKVADLEKEDCVKIYEWYSRSG